MSIQDVISGIAPWHIEEANVLDGLRRIPDNVVHCVVTSPPYWAVRVYGTNPQVWGGDPDCEHEWETGVGDGDGRRSFGFCTKCPAWLGELGSEPTVGLFIKNMTLIFREVRRVLHPSGVCWVDIGDTYFGGGRGPTGTNGIGDQEKRQGFTGGMPLQPGQRQQRKEELTNRAQERGYDVGAWGASPRAAAGFTDHAGGGLRIDDGVLKAKDMCLVPQRLAIAMQEDGWWIRSCVAWEKLNSMPESVTDRPVASWEPIWMCTKSARYYYDNEAVRERQKNFIDDGGKRPANKKAFRGGGTLTGFSQSATGFNAHVAEHGVHMNPAGKNLRNTWMLSNEPFDGEYCTTCHVLYYKKTKSMVRTKKVDGEDQRICPKCGGSTWLGHYASYPTELPKRAILAGSSEKGVCPKCYAPWERIIEESSLVARARRALREDYQKGGLIPSVVAGTEYKQKLHRARRGGGLVDPTVVGSGLKQQLHRARRDEANDVDLSGQDNGSVTLGWQPTCTCNAGEPIPSLVLDPFSGSGTSLAVAIRNGRRALGLELLSDYADMGRQRVGADSPLMQLLTVSRGSGGNIVSDAIIAITAEDDPFELPNPEDA